VTANCQSFTLVKAVAGPVPCNTAIIGSLSPASFGSSATVVPGQCVAFNLSIRNNSASAIPSLGVIDNLPAGLVGLAMTCPASPGSTCAVTTGGLTFNSGAGYSLGSGVTGAETFLAQVPTSGTICGPLVNTFPAGP